MPVTTIALVVLVAVFGIENVTDNLAEIGLAAIPSWIAVGLLYFLPLSLILAEFASALPERRGGIYGYMELGLGPTWAFVGTWSYFVGNLVYLQMVCSRLPIRLSVASTGRDVFEGATAVLPLLGVVICVLLTLLAARGVRVFARVAAWAGRVTLLAIGLLIVLPIAAVVLGLHQPATTYSLDALTPTLDLRYFSTFAWLLFAVAGAEVAAPYVAETENPQRNFPRAILLAALMVGGLYVLGSVTVSFLLPVGSLAKATAMNDAWSALALLLGLPPWLVARSLLTIAVFVSVTGYVIWMESPVRVMFADVPPGTFPRALTRSDRQGTHHKALWAQAAVVCTLTLVPLLSIVAGLSGSERFISILNDLTSLATVVPYLFISLAYALARHKGMNAPFKAVRSTPIAIGIGIGTFAISIVGYVGAGLYALQTEPVDWIYVATVYLGPALLIVLGLLLRRLSLGRHHRRH
jgi:amino acid transporter